MSLAVEIKGIKQEIKDYRLMSLIKECPDVTVEDVMCLILERQEYLGQEPDDVE